VAVVQRSVYARTEATLTRKTRRLSNDAGGDIGHGDLGDVGCVSDERTARDWLLKARYLHLVVTYNHKNTINLITASSKLLGGHYDDT